MAGHDQPIELPRIERRKNKTAKMQAGFAERKNVDELLRESEARFRSVLDNAVDVIYRLNLQTGRYDYFSPSVYTMIGYTPEEGLGMDAETVFHGVHPDDRPAVLAALERMEVSGRVEIDYRQMMKNGEYRWISNRMSLTRDADGRPLYRNGNLRDIDDRKRAEEALRVSEARFKSVLDNAVDIVYRVNLQTGRYDYFSPSAAKLFGYPIEELLDMGIEEILTCIHPSDLPAVRMTMKRLETTGREETDYRHLMKSGEYRWISNSMSLTRDRDGRPLYRNGYVRDITDRKRAEDALRESEEKYRLVSENSVDVIWLVDLATERFRFVSPSVTRLRGYTVDEVMQQTMKDALTLESYRLVSDSLPLWIDAFYRGDESLRVQIHEVDQPCKDGSVVPTEVVATLVKDATGRVSSILGVTRDISERRRAQEALQRSEHQFKVLTETSPMMILLHNGGKFVYANPAAEQASGYSRDELQDLEFWKFVTPEYASLVRLRGLARLRGEDVQPQYEVQIVTKNGESRWWYLVSTCLEYGGKPSILVTGMDITDRKGSERQLIVSLKEKETLLKEVHHRVKNNLQVISSLLSLQSQHLKDRSQSRLFDESRDRVRSMALIHEKLYGSSSFSQIEFTGYVKTLVEGLIGSYILQRGKVRYRVEGGHSYLTIEEAVPCGLIVNELVTNSLKYAFPGARAGEIVISVSQGQHYFSFTVSDDGVGLGPDFIEKNSSSLGLQLVSVLVQQLEGVMEIGPEPGASFCVSFPHKK